jgi:hypothetical protein
MIKALLGGIKDSSRTGIIFIALALASIVLFQFAGSVQRWHQQSARVYEEPTKVTWSLFPGRLIISAVSKKLQPCSVVSDSSVFLVAKMGDPEAPEPVVYPAKGVLSSEATGRPIIRVGETFLVGPWVLESSLINPQDLSRIFEISVVIAECRFAGTGLTRPAYIGPMRRP